MAGELRAVSPDSLVSRINAVQDKVSRAASQPAGDRVRGITQSTGFKVVNTGVQAIGGYAEARERGVGVAGSVADAGAAAAAAQYKAGPADAAISLVNATVKMVAPSAAPYTQAVADATPSQAIKSGLTSLSDTTGAVIQGVGKGDWSAMQNVADNQLRGKYGAVVQGYSMVGHALSGDSRELNKLSDDAASGKLGKLAQLGDWSGEGYWMLHQTLGAAVNRDSRALDKLSDDAAGGKLGPLAQFGDWLGDEIAKALMP
jgi:hypothetical protein